MTAERVKRRVCRPEAAHAFPAAQRPSENPQTRFSDGLLFFPPAPNRVRGRAAHPPPAKGRLKKAKNRMETHAHPVFRLFQTAFFSDGLCAWNAYLPSQRLNQLLPLLLRFSDTCRSKGPAEKTVSPLKYSRSHMLLKSSPMPRT